MSYVRALTICLRLVYFVSAAGCHCFDLGGEASLQRRDLPPERIGKRIKNRLS